MVVSASGRAASHETLCPPLDQMQSLHTKYTAELEDLSTSLCTMSHPRQSPHTESPRSSSAVEARCSP